MERRHQARETTDGRSLRDGLRAVFDEMMRCQNAKDMPGVLACLHAASPWREGTRQFLEPFMDHFTLHNSLLEFACIGQEGDYAYSRVRQSVEKVAGPAFNNLISENLVAYRRQDGEWKIWQQAVLSLTPLSTSEAP